MTTSPSHAREKENWKILDSSPQGRENSRSALKKVTAGAIPSFLVGCPSLAKLMPSQASETKVKDL
jgi:hypothetical protein